MTVVTIDGSGVFAESENAARWAATRLGRGIVDKVDIKVDKKGISR